MSFVPEGSDVEQIDSPRPETSSSSEPEQSDIETPPYVSDTNTPDNPAEPPDPVTQFEEVCHRYKQKMLTLSLKKSPTVPMDNEKSPIVINTSSDDECEPTSHERGPQNVTVRKCKHFTTKQEYPVLAIFDPSKCPQLKILPKRNPIPILGGIYLERERQ